LRCSCLLLCALSDLLLSFEQTLLFDMAHHLIYHPERERREFAGSVVYFDKTSGNQDPYIWSDRFLHSFCHATELRSPRPGDLNFWVCGDEFPEFTALNCDLVFVVEAVVSWPSANFVASDHEMVDSAHAYQDHYRWAHQHPYKSKIRRTLKANPSRSYQPQRQDGSLIDLVPCLRELGLSIDHLRSSLRKGFASKPMVLNDSIAHRLSAYIEGETVGG
jgi:hypothetical protein